MAGLVPSLAPLWHDPHSTRRSLSIGDGWLEVDVCLVKDVTEKVVAQKK